MTKILALNTTISRALKMQTGKYDQNLRTVTTTATGFQITKESQNLYKKKHKYYNY